MTSDQPTRSEEAIREAGWVSRRFLNDFCRTLERADIPIQSLIGDLPIPTRGGGEIAIAAPVEWDVFAELLRRLDASLDGSAGLERCGELIGQLAPARGRRPLRRLRRG